MIRIRSLALLLVLCSLVSSCATIQQKAQKIRQEEQVLFEASAQVGFILNTGKHISWNTNGPTPVIATPTTFYFGINEFPYNAIESATVGPFHADRDIFIKPTTYEDLLTVRIKNGWEHVFRFASAPKKLIPPESNPERRDIANRFATIIQQQRARVDLFGRIGSPRPIWLATNPGLVYEFWSVRPLYLNRHFPQEREAASALLKAARKPATDAFLKNLRANALAHPSNLTGYSFVDAGEIKQDWLHHKQIRKSLGNRDQRIDCLVLLDTPRIFLKEKLDPQGNPSLSLTFSTAARFYDTQYPRLASHHSLTHETLIPLPQLLKEGEGRILSELHTAMGHFTDSLHSLLNSPSLAMSTTPATGN